MVKILVVQFREDLTLQHERDCILNKVKDLDNLQFDFVSIFDDKKNILDNSKYILDKYQKIIFGGSAGLYLAKGHTGKDYKKAKFSEIKTDKLLNSILENDFPFFGACYGFQLLAKKLGADIVFDKDLAETEFADIYITVAGKKDKLFKLINSPFKAVVGHQDTAINLPKLPQLEVLCYTQKVYNHAIRYKKNIYATQFHGELTTDEFFYRLNLFPEYKKYAKGLEPQDTDKATIPLIRFLKN